MKCPNNRGVRKEVPDLMKFNRCSSHQLSVENASQGHCAWCSQCDGYICCQDDLFIFVCRKYISDVHQISLSNWQGSMLQGGSFICCTEQQCHRDLWKTFPSSNLLYPIAQLPLYHLEKIKISKYLKIGRNL